MTKSTLRTRLGRGVATGLSIALVAGASLVAAAPAQAAPVATHIAKADIGTTYGSVGWSSYAPDSLQDVGGALSIAYGATIQNTLATPAPLSAYTDALTNKLISWTTNDMGSPSEFQFSATNGEISSTVSSAGAVNGTNTPGADSLWTLQSQDSALNINTPTALPAIIAALDAAGMTEVVSYGIYSPVSASELVSLDVFGSAFTFGGPPSIPLDGITVTITGDGTVGSTLTGTTAGWPVGTTLSYEWGYDGGNFGGAIEGATGTSYVVSGEYLGNKVSLFVLATLDGYSETRLRSNTVVVTTTQLPAAAAPVANSTGLAAFLASKAVTPQAQTATGLPAGELNPGTSYTANVVWTAADAFVDVYAFSKPVLVGTFPVVNGVAQINLSSTVLSQLEAGAHTLVVTGQTSGAVQAVSLSVAFTLAATGPNLAAPIGIAALLLMLGGALVVARRRSARA